MLWLACRTREVVGLTPIRHTVRQQLQATPMCLCHQAVQFSTGQMAVMLCDWEGITVGLASHWPMRHRLQWFIHLWAHGHREGDEHPTYAPNWSMVHFIFMQEEQVSIFHAHTE